MRIFLMPLFACLVWSQTDERVSVISAGRGWLFKGRLLARGVLLDAGERLNGNASAGDLILDCRQKGGWIFYSCKTDHPCEVPACDAAKVPNTVNSQRLGALARFNEAYLRREPKEVVTLGVRSGGNPSDAVLLHDAKGVHWGPALNRVVEGHYCLQLNPLPTPLHPAPRVFTLAWDRDTDAEGIGQATSILPGLYKLDKGTPSSGGACVMDSDEAPAWVVIAPGAQFNQVNAQWKENAPRLTQIERDGAPPSVISNLRHAILAGLADGVGLR